MWSPWQRCLTDSPDLEYSIENLTLHILFKLWPLNYFCVSNVVLVLMGTEWVLVLLDPSSCITSLKCIMVFKAKSHESRHTLFQSLERSPLPLFVYVLKNILVFRKMNRNIFQPYSCNCYHKVNNENINRKKKYFLGVFPISPVLVSYQPSFQVCVLATSHSSLFKPQGMLE